MGIAAIVNVVIGVGVGICIIIRICIGIIIAFVFINSIVIVIVIYCHYRFYWYCHYQFLSAFVSIILFVNGIDIANVNFFPQMFPIVFFSVIHIIKKIYTPNLKN